MSSAFDEAFDFGAFDLDVTGATYAVTDAIVTVMTLTDARVLSTLMTLSDAPVTVMTLSDAVLAH